MRVGAPRRPPESWAKTSTGKIWRYLLDELATRVELRRQDPVDVWIWPPWLWGTDDQTPPDGPLVVNLHEAPSEADGLDPAVLAHLDAVSRRLVARASRVFCGSEHARSQIVERYGIDRVDVAPYGVDLDVFQPDGPVERLERPYVLFVGSVLPRKNLATLRAAMERLPDLQLVLVAGRALDPASQRLADEAVAPVAGRAVPNFYGVDDCGLAALMRGAEVLCLPSFGEGFGMPVAEAMACGTPVVVSDRGSLPEVVGDAGIVVEPSVDGVCDGIARAVAGQREWSARALARGRTFTWGRCADAVVRSVAQVHASGDPRVQ